MSNPSLCPEPAPTAAMCVHLHAAEPFADRGDAGTRWGRGRVADLETVVIDFGMLE